MFLGSLHQASLFSVDIYYASANASVKLQKGNITRWVSLSLHFKFLQEFSRIMQDTRTMAESSFCWKGNVWVAAELCLQSFFSRRGRPVSVLGHNKFRFFIVLWWHVQVPLVFYSLLHLCTSALHLALCGTVWSFLWSLALCKIFPFFFVSYYYQLYSSSSLKSRKIRIVSCSGREIWDSHQI